MWFSPGTQLVLFAIKAMIDDDCDEVPMMNSELNFVLIGFCRLLLALYIELAIVVSYKRLIHCCM